MAIPIVAAVPSTCAVPIDAPDNSLASRQFRRRVNNIMLVLTVCLLCFVMFWCVKSPVFAEDGDAITKLEDSAKSIGEQIFGVLRVVVIVAATCYLLVAAVQWIFGGQRGGQMAMGRIYAIAGALLLAIFAPAIVNFFTGLGSDSGWSTLNFTFS